MGSERRAGLRFLNKGALKRDAQRRARNATVPRISLRVKGQRNGYACGEASVSVRAPARSNVRLTERSPIGLVR
jgi:hypothetical protein